MLGLSATYNYYLFNGNVDMRKGIFRLREVVQSTMGQNPDDSHNVFIFMSKSRKIVKLLHYERGFYVLYEKRPLMGKFKSRCTTQKRRATKFRGQTWFISLRAL